MMMHNSTSSSNVASFASNGLKKRWQSEDSESDNVHSFNPCVDIKIKEPPPRPQQPHSSADKTKPQASTTSASSESSNSESSEDSSDEEKTTTVTTTSTTQSNRKQNENDTLDNFSLGNFLNKVKNQSPAQNRGGQGEATLNSSIAAENAGIISPLRPEDDISDLLSQKRSPFPDNLITDGGANPILELRPLSPLKGSPPPVPRNKSQRRRRSHKTKKSSASAANGESYLRLLNQFFTAFLVVVCDGKIMNADF